jgi:outer membrane protein OmpA-like peptidoglycan-associated protein
MKKLFLTTLVVMSFTVIRAQSYIGYYHDNYAGVQSVMFNPASIADSPFKAHINLFSFSALGSNDYYGVTATDLLKSSFNFEKEAKLFPSTQNNFLANVDIMGLSVMLNIAPKHTIALFTRARGFGNIVNLNGDFLEQIQDKINTPTSTSFDYKDNNFNVAANTWAEIGLSYGTVLLDKNVHFIKGGLTLKYLQGIANAYIKTDNLNFNYTRNGINTDFNPITTSGTLIYGGTQDFENSNKEIKLNTKSSGLGVDLGIVYEWRPNITDLDKYKVRFGLSVTDIGSINYDNASEKKYNLNKIIRETDYNNTSSIKDLLEKNYAVIGNDKSSKVYLPTAAHVNADWNINNKFYVNLNGDINMNSRTNLNTNAIANTVSVTPRYQSKWIGVYLPLNYMDYRGFQAGFGFRAGPLFIGSGSIITNLISKESKGLDIHGGLSIPIYGGKPKVKDKDGDGVLDKVDKCPEIAGAADNNGCPWKDSDKDGVLDKDDKCPNVAGSKENKGCPIEDADKDGVVDKQDKCPKVAGPKDNDGCPWPDTDKDGVLDKDDKCPQVPGPASNQGCPEEKKVEPLKEIKPDVIKEISMYSKTILFDTGKASIKQESYQNLDAIVAIMNEYEKVNFKIEGHTDSAGKADKNLKLSKERAAAVKKYLTDKGVKESRLTSQGYGSKKPITSNKTVKGRNKNRRVEINLVK